MRRTRFNPKWRMRQSKPPDEELQLLVNSVKYAGNPEHKRNPGDFRLTPPVQPRADKSLCDDARVFTLREATELLREGVQRGLISEQVSGPNRYPQNIWVVTRDGIPLEAQLENSEMGTYHGYPIPDTDPFQEEVLRRWEPS